MFAVDLQVLCSLKIHADIVQNGFPSKDMYIDRYTGGGSYRPGIFRVSGGRPMQYEVHFIRILVILASIHYRGAKQADVQRVDAARIRINDATNPLINKCDEATAESLCTRKKLHCLFLVGQLRTLKSIKKFNEHRAMTDQLEEINFKFERTLTFSETLIQFFFFNFESHHSNGSKQ